MDDFTIGGETIAPGSEADIGLPITTMATGFNSRLAVRVLHGAKPGPTVFISGAIHGDELNGTAIIHRLAAEIDPRNLAGTLLLVPVANIFGFLNHTRYLPDRRDLNRSFPGSTGGSLAAQVANVFFSEIVARASLGIDIHTAAIHRYNLPQIRIAAGNNRLAQLAKVFGAPVFIESPLRDGSLRALAAKEGVDMLLMEAGEALRFDRFAIESGVAGVKRVLAHMEMIEADADLPEPHPSARSKKTQWVRSPRGGVSHRARKSGDAVKKGDLLAAVTGLFGEEPEELLSPIDGIIIGHATLPVVHQGDAMFHIAQVEDAERVGERIETLSDAIYAGEAESFAEALLDEDEVI